MLEGLKAPTDDALCKMGRAASNLSPEDYQILADALEDPKWTTSALNRALLERGFRVGETIMRRHRRKECTCARAA
jgi:hypothetical protein